MFFFLLLFLSLVFSGASWPLCHENRKSALPPRPRRRRPSKKRQKKKTFINNSGGKGRNRSPTASPTNVGRMPKSKRAPPLVFFPNKKRLKATKKKSAGAFIIINNETLVWSEKDGGSAFAGGDDGQGDTHYALFSLFTLSLSSRGGVSRVSFVLLESQSHF